MVCLSTRVVTGVLTRLESVKINPHSAAFRPPLKSPHHAYCGAKAYCMSYLQARRHKYPFSIVQVIPGTVLGPSELINTASEAYSQMDRMSKALLFNEMKPRYAFGFVHIEDCARVHVEALDEHKIPENEIPDWFVAAAATEEGQSAMEIWKGVGDMVEKEFVGQVQEGLFTVGRDNLPINIPYKVSSRLTERMLLGGNKFRGLVECVREVAKWYVDLVEEEKTKRF